LVISALAVVVAHKPVYSVLALVACFFNAAGLFVLLGAEFVAFVLVIVYAGAVAVLFLFVVMMLETEPKQTRVFNRKEVLAALAVTAVLLAEGMISALGFREGAANVANADNIRAIGRVLYTDYFYPFQVTGVVLLVAIVGAISITMRGAPHVKRQKISEQINRMPEEVLEIVKKETGEGTA